MYNLELLMMDGKDSPKHVECYAKINIFEKLVHLVGFTMGINYCVVL
jgi:hypothetical protein